MLGIFLDSETNGLNPQEHKIIEIAFKIIDLLSGELKASYQSIICQPFEEWQKSDPNSLKINCFTWEEVAKGKELERVAEEVIALFIQWKIKRGSSVFICQNPSFDRAFFSQIININIQEQSQWPYHWLDLASMYWVESIKKGNQNLYPWKTGISKDCIAAAYHLLPEEKPHRAINGVNHLLLCYESVVGFPCK